MSEVKRYSANGTEFGIRESTTGDYVSYDDYAALETEITMLKSRVPECQHDWHELHQDRHVTVYGCRKCHKYQIGRGTH